MKGTLLELQGDLSAVSSMLSAQSDHGSWWLPQAHAELRRAFVRRRLNDAAQVSQLITLVLQAKEGSTAGELSDYRIHQEGARWISDGIRAVLDCDHAEGLALLGNVTKATYCHESLQWVAWFWTSKSLAEVGDLPQALRAADSALQISRQLDSEAVSTSLCNRGELHFLMGERDRAHSDLAEAERIFSQADDTVGIAMVRLAQAQLFAAAGDMTAALEAAAHARNANPDWNDPVVFLARQALIAADYSQAKWVLELFYQREPRPPEILREMRLVDLGKRGVVSTEAISQYCRVRDLPPTDETIAHISELVDANPDFLQLRELLAWTLFKRGYDDRASTQFETLAGECLDPELQASVLLGVGCVANRRNRHRQPGARLHATAAAVKAAGERSGAFAVSPGALQRPPERDATWNGVIGDGLAMLDDDDDFEDQQERITEFDVLTSAHLDTTAVGLHVRGASTGQITEESAAQSGAPTVAFTGDIQVLPVPDLLEFLKASQRTGTLMITSQRGVGLIQMRDGKLTGGASPGCDSIGGLLRKANLITEEQLRSAANAQESDHPDRLIGAILVDRGLVTPEQVKGVLADQVRYALLEMMSWEAGCFAFDPDPRSQRNQRAEIEVELDTQGVLLDVLRMLDESSHQGERADDSPSEDVELIF